MQTLPVKNTHDYYSLPDYKLNKLAAERCGWAFPEESWMVAGNWLGWAPGEPHIKRDAFLHPCPHLSESFDACLKHIIPILKQMNLDVELHIYKTGKVYVDIYSKYNSETISVIEYDAETSPARALTIGFLKVTDKE